MGRTIVNPVIRDTTRFLKTADETGGSYTEVEVTLQPGGGTPLHYHRNIVETFTAVSGLLRLEVNGETITLSPGNSHTVPVNTVHRFFNSHDKEIVFRTVIHPGHKGFENALCILYGLAGDGLTDKKSVPRKLMHLALVASMSDMYMPGLMKLFTPLFRRLADKGRRTGIEQQLIDKYCS